MSSTWYLIVDANDRIVQSGYCSLGDLGLHPGAIPWSGPVEGTTHYYESGVVHPRMTLTATWNKTTISADGVDEAVLSPLPIPCTVIIDGVESVVTDGSLNLSVESPGVYDIVVDHPHYLRQQWGITGE